MIYKDTKRIFMQTTTSPIVNDIVPSMIKVPLSMSGILSLRDGLNMRHSNFVFNRNFAIIKSSPGKAGTAPVIEHQLYTKGGTAPISMFSNTSEDTTIPSNTKVWIIIISVVLVLCLCFCTVCYWMKLRCCKRGTVSSGV